MEERQKEGGREGRKDKRQQGTREEGRKEKGRGTGQKRELNNNK